MPNCSAPNLVVIVHDLYRLLYMCLPSYLGFAAHQLHIWSSLLTVILPSLNLNQPNNKATLDILASPIE
jgi:hypothetical protein